MGRLSGRQLGIISKTPGALNSMKALKARVSYD
jgi:hypothetical protein